MCVAAAGPAFAQDQASVDAQKQANNPLANIKAINFQNYYVPKLYGVPDQTADTFWFRTVFPIKRWLFRASLPLNTVPTGLQESKSGLGDFNVFGAYLVRANPDFSFGVGPLLVLPTATEDELGSGKVQIGGAVVAFDASSAVVQYGGLVTFQASVAGDDVRDDTSLFILQPFGFLQLGKGTYLRTAPIWVFDLKTGHYNVPFSVGIGKVMKVDRVVYNVFVEPQWTVLHNGTGQPVMQIFAGVNVQITQ
jgi:hypothetical protein